MLGAGCWAHELAACLDCPDCPDCPERPRECAALAAERDGATGERPVFRPHPSSYMACQTGQDKATAWLRHGNGVAELRCRRGLPGKRTFAFACGHCSSCRLSLDRPSHGDGGGKRERGGLVSNAGQRRRRRRRRRQGSRRVKEHWPASAPSAGCCTPCPAPLCTVVQRRHRHSSPACLSRLGGRHSCSVLPEEDVVQCVLRHGGLPRRAGRGR